MSRRQEWENNELATLEDGVRKEQRSNFLEIGKLLTEILDKELYLLKGYKSFVKYIDDEPVFRFTGKHAIRLVRTYRFINSLPRGVNVPTSERQVRPLIKLGFEDAREVWLEAQRRTKEVGKPVTGELVAELVGQINRKKGLLQSTSQRTIRHQGRPRRGGQDSDASHTDFEDWAVTKVEEPPRWEADNTQSAVLLLAEFENLRERVKELPQQQRERLLMEWRDSMDDDLNDMESSHGSRSGISKIRKRKQLVEPDTPTSFPRWSITQHTEPWDCTFAVRKRRSKTHRFKRVWKVPSYLDLQVVRTPGSDSSEVLKSAARDEPNKELLQVDGSTPDVQAAYDLGYLASCCREKEPENEEQVMPLSFGIRFVPITAT